MTCDHEKNQPACSFWRTRYALGLIVFGGIAGYFLLTEHLAHVIGVLPFLILLICPIMHLFMHHGHEHHHEAEKTEAPVEPEQRGKQP